MNVSIELYNEIKETVERFSEVLHFDTLVSKTGRKLALSIVDSIALGLFKQQSHIATKKAVYDIMKPSCSYKTFVVNMNRWASLAYVILVLILKRNRMHQHPVKHVDSTSVEVCKFKNANAHKTMKQFAAFAKNKHGTYFGLKLHIISDLKRKILQIRFTPANVDDRTPVKDMSQDIWGIIIGDAGCISKVLEQLLYEEGLRWFFAKPRKNMKKIASHIQLKLYDTRMLIELNFRNLKLFYGLITSLPRSVAGYCANYIYSILAYVIV